MMFTATEKETPKEAILYTPKYYLKQKLLGYEIIILQLS